MKFTIRREFGLTKIYANETTILATFTKDPASHYAFAAMVCALARDTNDVSVFDADHNAFIVATTGDVGGSVKFAYSDGKIREAA